MTTEIEALERRERKARVDDEQRVRDLLERHLRWHAQAGGRGMKLEDLHAKVATTRYGSDGTRRRLQELADDGRAHKIVVDQVALWRHGTEPVNDDSPTTADRVLEAVRAWPTWVELEDAVRLRGFDLGEITTPLEREGRVVRRRTFRRPDAMSWLPTEDADKALTAREVEVLLFLEGLPVSTDARLWLRGEATDAGGWTSVVAVRERLQFTSSTWSYTTGSRRLGPQSTSPLLERRGSTSAAELRLTAAARELLAELRERGLLRVGAPPSAPAAAGAADERELEEPSVGESDDVAGDGLVQPPPLDPPRVDDPVVVGDASESGREGTDEDGVAGDDTPTDSDDGLCPLHGGDVTDDCESCRAGAGWADVTRWGLDDDGHLTDRPQIAIGATIDQAVHPLNESELTATASDNPELTLADCVDTDTDTGNSEKSDGDVVFEVRECVLCGCTDDRACVESDGETPCYWATPSFTTADVCSACVELLVIESGQTIGAVELVRAEVRGLRHDAAEEATRAGREGAQLLAALLAQDLRKLGGSLAALEQRLAAVDQLGRRVEQLGVVLDRVERHVEELRSRPPVADAFRRLLEVHPAGDVSLPEPGADRRCLSQVELVILEQDVPQYRSPVTRKRLQCCRFDRGHPADKRDASAFHRTTPDNTIGPILWLDGDERVVLVRERPVGERPHVRRATEREVRDYDATLNAAKTKGAA